jgi:hypothetical protein
MTTAANPESILDSVKKVVGFEPDYTAFDLDLVMHINMAFGILKQAGVGSDTGFMITDNTTLWAQYLSDLTLLGMVKSYITMAVRQAFDPPSTSFGQDALQQLITQLIWRINIASEESNPPPPPIDKTFEELKWKPLVVKVDFSPVIDIDAQTGNVFVLSLTGDCTINAPVNGLDGQHITLELTSNGNFVLWGPGWNFGDAGYPALSPARTDVISSYFSESVTEWRAGFTSGF